MNFTKLFTVAAIVFASFIQVGCGTANPANTLGYTQAVNGVCPAGSTLVANNQCAPNNTGAYNNNYNTGAGSCTSGASYAGSTYGCQPGYIQQGNSCVCQASITGTGTQQNTGCTLAGYYQVQGGCYQQGPCYQGYAYVTPTGMCYRVQ